MELPANPTPSSIEELIKQATGKSFAEMTDEELLAWVNDTRSSYQKLTSAFTDRKRRQEKKAAADPNTLDISQINLDEVDF